MWLTVRSKQDGSEWNQNHLPLIVKMDSPLCKTNVHRLANHGYADIFGDTPRVQYILNCQRLLEKSESNNFWFLLAIVPCIAGWENIPTITYQTV